MNSVAIGIDIGGTNTVLGIVDINGLIYESCIIKTQKHNLFEEYMAEIFDIIDSWRLKYLDKKIIGVGIGAPNGSIVTACIESAANLKWTGKLEIVKLIEDRFGFPCILTNDANAATIGEMVFGGAKNFKDFVLITIGTGLGSGIVCNGELLYGHDGFAGEFGHIIVDHNGRECGCGRKGCLETYVSASGIKRTAFELLAYSNKETVLREYSYQDLSSKIVCQAAIDGDYIALKVFEKTAEILGKSLANLIAITSPQAIFLYGGIAKSGDLLLNPLKQYVDLYCLSNFKGKCELKFSDLDGNIAVLGAASLILKSC
ncbi:MAG: ROK family protein [Marinifilaceae bacterium]|jgi:glucokinase|nr:ROK family protein [Marinifilaceae bacterium]